MLTHKEIRTKAPGNVKVKTEYEKLDDEFALLDEFLKARTSQGLNQAQVAEKIGSTQSAVAWMESGSRKHSLSLATCPGMPRRWAASWRFGRLKMRDQQEI